MYLSVNTVLHNIIAAMTAPVRRHLLGAISSVHTNVEKLAYVYICMFRLS